MPQGPICVGMRAISAVLSPASAASRSITETSSVPPFAANRYVLPFLAWPSARPLVSGKQPQAGWGESSGTGENVPLACAKGCSNVGGPLGETKGTGNLGQGNPGAPAPS